MKQSATESLVLWSVLAVVIGVTYGIGTSAEVRDDDSSTRTVLETVPDQVYPGPSYDYTITPHSESLTYSRPGTSRVESAVTGRAN